MPRSRTAPPAAGPSTTGRDRPGFVPEPVVLGGVSWDDYVRFGDEPANAGLRLTYDAPARRLELIMTTGERHEAVSNSLLILVACYARVRRVRLRPVGATTWRRRGVGGAEGDNAFYVSRFDEVAGRDGNVPDLDGGAAPPDLVVEVDVTSPGVAKLPIYARLGVREVWVWEDEILTAHRLDGDRYRTTDRSVELPGFPLAFAAELLTRRADAATFELEEALEARLRAAG